MDHPNLDNRRLIQLIGATLVVIALYFILLPLLPEAWHTPGSSELYLMGVLGTVLLLAAAGFSIVKRGKSKTSPVRWFAAHVNLACIGSICIVIHSAGYVRSPPALMILALGCLALLGLWARIYGAKWMAATLGTKRSAFAKPNSALQAQIRDVIEKKKTVLELLDPPALESTFSPNLSHWLCQPFRTAEYIGLIWKEETLIGVRKSVGPVQAYWRALHLLLASMFVAGLFIHVITVTFFAGYVADGGEIYWWHLTRW